MFTLDYAAENKFERLNLYTDNLDLATKNIKKVLKNHNFIDVKLTWVPRELNTSADKLSKEGQKINKTVTPIFVGPSANQADKKIKQKRKKAKKLVYGEDLIGPAEPLKIEGTFRLFHGWSYDKKVIFLSKLAKDDSNEQEFIRMLKANGVKDDYRFNTSNANIIFIRMAKTLLSADPSTSEYVKKRLGNLKDTRNNQKLQTLTFKKFSKEFDKRKPKNLLEKEAA